MKIATFLLVTFSLLKTINIEAQTNYYVSPTGSNANNGTSMAAAWATVQNAATKATPNSIVNIVAGTYNELVTINVNGTSGNPITFKNYQNGTVIISGSGFSGAYSNLITIENKSNIVIDGLILEKLTAAGADGILLRSSAGSQMANISLKNLKIRNIGYSTNASSIPISGDNAHGIEVYGRGITTTDAIKNINIENCEVYNNVNGYSENITINGNVDGYSILNNSIHDNTNIGIDVAGNHAASANSALDHARNGTISGNFAFNNISLVANSSGIYCDGCQNTVIERNTSHHNTVGITVGCENNGAADNVTIRNNFVHQNTSSGIEIGGYTTTTTGIVLNSVINNNTCYRNDMSNLHGQLLVKKVSNCSIFNNILHSDGNLLFYVDNIAPQSFTSNYNEFYTTQGNVSLAQVNYQWSTMSYTTYKTNTSKDANSLFSNPQFVSTNLASLDLHLQGTSPAINAGNPLFSPLAAEKDFDGQSRANGIVDIGADEYFSALPVTFLSFTVTCSNHEKLLNWVTSSEIDNTFFVVEKSIDGNRWEQLGVVESIGNSSNATHYSFVDTKQAAIAYYKLKQVDLDGRSTYSQVLSLSNCDRELIGFTLVPNPASDNVFIQLHGITGKQQVQIFNLAGAILKTTDLPQNMRINIGDLSNGIYCIKLINYPGVQKFIISR